MNHNILKMSGIKSKQKLSAAQLFHNQPKPAAYISFSAET